MLLGKRDVCGEGHSSEKEKRRLRRRTLFGEGKMLLGKRDVCGEGHSSEKEVVKHGVLQI